MSLFSRLCLFVSGLHKECGSEKPHGDFASNTRYVTVRYFNTDTTNDNHFDIIFTAFHKGMISFLQLFHKGWAFKQHFHKGGIFAKLFREDVTFIGYLHSFFHKGRIFTVLFSRR